MYLHYSLNQLQRQYAVSIVYCLCVTTLHTTNTIYQQTQTWKPLGKATLLNDGPAHHDDPPANNTTNDDNTDTTHPNTTTTTSGGTGNNILDSSGIKGITDSAGISGGVNSDRPSFDFGSRYVIVCVCSVVCVGCVPDLSVDRVS